MRRILVIMTALSAVLLTTPGTAVATTTGSVSSPGSDGSVASVDPVPIEVTVERDCALGCDGVGDDRVEQVVVHLLNADGKSVGSTPLSLQSGETRERQIWGGRSLDPLTLDSFGEPEVCNGGWTLEALISWRNPLDELRTAKATRKVTLSAPPTAPAKVDVTTGVEKASLSWDKVSGYEDLKGYAIERSSDGGKKWKGVGGVTADKNSFTDESAPAGQVDYRVSSLRADGLVNGKPADPCKDDEGSLVSSAKHPDSNLQYATAGGNIQAAPTPTQGGSDGGSGAARSGSGDGGSGGSGGIGAPPAPSGDSSSPEAQEELPGVGAPPAPSGPEPDSFYGEDLEFQEELNYGDQEAVGPGPEGTNPDEVVIDENLATGESESFLNLERAAVPIAVGLLLIALGLHLRRWMNAPVTVGANGGSVNGGPPE